MRHGMQVVDWGMLAGYEQQKAAIEDTLLLALQHPDVFDEVARGTRKHFASNRPRAVLFEGPPGCGKTTSARCARLPVLCPASPQCGAAAWEILDLSRSCGVTLISRRGCQIWQLVQYVYVAYHGCFDMIHAL